VLVLYRKINELEEELKVVGNNMKALEIAEQEVTLSDFLFRPIDWRRGSVVRTSVFGWRRH